MSLRIYASSITLLFSFNLVPQAVEGDRSFTLANGKTGFCRDIKHCAKYSVYEESDCPCKDSDVCCINSGISRKKCDEYGKYVYSEEFGAALTWRRVATTVSHCKIEVPLIVGGEEAKDKEFPHMVAIGFGPKRDISWQCGGSLISERHVLTAAHCNQSDYMGPAAWALLGALSLDDVDENDSARQLHDIVERILHPQFQPPSRYNDIAIFKLGSDAIINAGVRPACLNVDSDITSSELTASGWGKLKYGATTGSEHLMKVRLDFIGLDTCSKTFQVDFGRPTLPEGIVESQLCAGKLEGGKDTCQGDSGGPLQIELATPYCMWSIVGVTSFGKFCGFANTPAIYTRISSYIPWIESVVWSDEIDESKES